ncbi:MAG: EamA family transporter [Planctomycetota bacterium]|jgi:drug/metabolite transporter (DMT)-like permease
MWIYLGILSAVCLGFYDVCRKYSLKENPVIPVLFYATLSGTVLALIFAVIYPVLPGTLTGSSPGFKGLSFRYSEQIYIAIKALVVGLSWILGYLAMRRLPISIVVPIFASYPFWILLGAVFFFGESPTTLQWAGITLIFFSYYMFSLIGSSEGINFLKDRWVLCVFAASLLAAVSSLYDKYLFQTIKLEPVSVQVTYSIYMTILFGILYAISEKKEKEEIEKLSFKYTIPLIGIFLVISDLVYFKALTNPEALISILSSIRSSNIIIAFALSCLLFKEQNKVKKIAAIAGILAGVVLIVAF